MTTDTAYQKALHFAKHHYENFPVASFLIKKELRRDVAIIYWFARTADDFSDEGILPDSERIRLLDEFRLRLDNLLKGNYSDEYDLALHTTIKSRNLEPRLFYDLLSAFRQDVVKKEYANFEELLDYCKRSANPVGRLILQLHNVRNDDAFSYSDRICTALQLTNFYQDTEIDVLKGRLYYPLDELKHFGVDRIIFEKMENSINFRALLEHSVIRTQKMFNEGKSLFGFLNGRLKFEIKWTVLGGETILKKIARNDYRIFSLRPVLSKKDFLLLLFNSFLQ